MKTLAYNVANVAYKTVVGIIILPFIAVAFGITKLLGGEPLSMDGMGAGFMMMCAIAVMLGIGCVAFTLGYFFG